MKPGNKTLEERTVGGLHAALLPHVTALEGVAHDTPLLDLGCGTGAWLKRLHDAGFRDLWGIDRDAQGFGASRIAHFIPADLDDIDTMLQVREPRFALVTAIEVIEHVANPQRLVETAVRALAARGWLFITTPNIYSLRSRVRFLLASRMTWFEQGINTEPDHIHPLLLDAYGRKVFDPLGLSLVRVWTYPERGSAGSRWFARLAARALGILLRDELPGDSLCLLLRKL